MLNLNGVVDICSLSLSLSLSLSPSLLTDVQFSSSWEQIKCERKEVDDGRNESSQYSQSKWILVWRNSLFDLNVALPLPPKYITTHPISMNTLFTNNCFLLFLFRIFQ